MILQLEKTNLGVRASRSQDRWWARGYPVVEVHHTPMTCSVICSDAVHFTNNFFPF